MDPLSLLILAAVDIPDTGFLTDVAPVLDLGISGLLLVTIVWFLRQRERQIGSGEWVPLRELDYLRADRDARLAEKDAQIARAVAVADEYRAAHETSERARELQGQQIHEAVDALRLQSRFFDAFRGLVERRRDDDEPAPT